WHLSTNHIPSCTMLRLAQLAPQKPRSFNMNKRLIRGTKQLRKRGGPPRRGSAPHVTAPLVHVPQVLNRMLEEVDRDFNLPFFRESPLLSGMEDWARMDVIETKKEWKVTVDLPGCDKDNIETDVTDGYLHIKAERSSEEETEEEGHFHQSERAHGMMSRTLELPSYVDENRVDAVFKNGVLTLSFAKHNEAVKKGKVIEIK
ncbi:unnamed protein product, partial [Chrysoparadoxa australica]